MRLDTLQCNVSQISLCSVVFAAQSNFLKVVQTVWKVGRDGIEAGTNLVTDSVPRSIARVSVTVVALALSLFVLKSLLSTVVASELRMLIRYVLQMRLMKSGRILVDMMERLILMEDSENISLAPFVAMDMSKIGHASIQVSLGERSWPPAAGYSFVCSVYLLAFI